MSFNDFKEEVRPRPIRSTVDVMNDVKNILETTAWEKSS